MQKLLISMAICASLTATGCSTVSKLGDTVTDSLDDLPFIYRMDIQQGNMVEQSSINQLKIGMTKSQVRYVMGTPMLVDTFHLERWDYIYRLKKGNKAPEQKRIALFFDNERLSRTEGDLEPGTEVADSLENQETVVSVPDFKPNQGVITRILETVGLDTEQTEEE